MYSYITSPSPIRWLNVWFLIGLLSLEERQYLQFQAIACVSFLVFCGVFDNRFTNVRRRTLPSIIQARNEERQKKGLAAIKSRSRWESDPRQPTVKETSGRQSKPQGDMLPMYGRLDSGFGDQANSLWSYSLKPMPATSDATDKTASSGTPMAYCPIATPTQPMWHTASVAVAHVRNAIYTGECWSCQLLLLSFHSLV